jgi:hypothetical protein
MFKISRTFRFNIAMKYWLLLFCLIIALKGFSQEKSVSGIVFDKDSKARVAAVNIRNTTTGISVYNDLKGEFKINASQGDQLIFSKDSFHPDTIKIQSNAPLAIYLQPVAIQLSEVTITDTALSPQKRLEATRREYNKVYGSLASNDFLTSPSSGPAGLGIDALYNAISREGRDAARLRQIIENDYRQNVIDYRFNRTYVGNITGLKDQKLTEFMFRYRPGYYTTTTATDYEFILSIRANLKRFLRSSRAYESSALKSK